MKNQLTDITPERLRELKDAGFPIIELAKQAVGNSDNCIMCGFPFIHVDGQTFLRPTMEELTDAIELCNIDKWAVGWDNGNYYAHTFTDKEIYIEGCSTPAEALARLWLAIKK